MAFDIENSYRCRRQRNTKYRLVRMSACAINSCVFSNRVIDRVRSGVPKKYSLFPRKEEQITYVIAYVVQFAFYFSLLANHVCNVDIADHRVVHQMYQWCKVSST